MRVHSCGSVAEHADDAGGNQQPGQVHGFSAGESGCSGDVVDGASRGDLAAEHANLGDVHLGGKVGSGVFEDEGARVSFRVQHRRGADVSGVTQIQGVRECLHRERHGAQRRRGLALVGLDLHLGKFHHGAEGGQQVLLVQGTDAVHVDEPVLHEPRCRGIHGACVVGLRGCDDSGGD